MQIFFHFVFLLWSVVLDSKAALQLHADTIPRGWKIEAETEARPTDIEGIAKKIGARIDRLSSQVISISGLKAQVNYLHCIDEKNALIAQEFIAKNRGAEFVSRNGNTVIEYAKCNVLFAKKLRDLLGFTPNAERAYEAQFSIGCVDQLDYMETNRVFNLFLGEGKEKEIQELSKDWSFGKSIRLWTGKQHRFRAEYSFEPLPEKKVEEGELTTFHFQNPPRRYGIPYVNVKATIWVKNAYQPETARARIEPPKPTSRWPTGSVRELATQLTAKGSGTKEKIEAILSFCHSEIRYEGITGSRYGVEQVLQQKHGHCWDKSDLFITLCRAISLPSRQVAGWVPALKSGHIWTEVFIENEGWLPVDPTTPWTGISDDYVPWFLTNDGEMPILYLAMPVISKF